jgi:uncharacterized membrane protein
VSESLDTTSPNNGGDSVTDHCLEPFGMDSDFIHKFRQQLLSGRSAILIVQSPPHALTDVADRLDQFCANLLTTYLSAEQERRLRRGFSAAG